MPIKKEKFVIIDGNALLHRCFHAIPPLTISDGTVVNAVYGFTVVVLKILKEIQPQYMVICFDRKEKTFRHEKYKEYKAQREKKPDELYQQIPIIYKMLETFQITTLDKAGYEADDLIGALVKENEKHSEIRSIIVTGDLDTLQLVSKNTHVYAFKKGISEMMEYEEKQVFERYGLKPHQLIDYKALRGDPSDNIPGVRGIGEKTAISLIQEFHTLENLYKQYQKSDSIKDRVKDLLRQQEKEAYDSKELVTIHSDIDIAYDKETFKIKPFNREAIITLFQQYEFKSLIAKIPKQEEQTTLFTPSAGESISVQKAESQQYALIDTKAKFSSLMETLCHVKEFAFDTETTDLMYYKARLVGISLSFEQERAYYVDLRNFHDEFMAELKPIFENAQIKKIAHNAKFDQLLLKKSGIELKGLWADTMVASYILSPGTRTHSLDHLAFVEFGHEMISYEDMAGKGKKQIPILDVPIQTLSDYACEDADFTYRLWPVLSQRLKEHDLENVFYEIEMPLIQVLVEMEHNGVKIDVDFLHTLSKKHTKTIDILEEDIYELAGGPFNIKSTKQLATVLFDQLQLSMEGVRKTKTGISTAAPELEKIREKHKIIDLILRFRELVKLKSTYIDAIPKLVNPKTNRVHTSFNQTITATGRLSSSDPNVQNIPVKTEIGAQIRQGFIADKGFLLADLDYSQIELRIVASLAQDEGMIEDFKQKKDIHASTAAKINGIDISEVTSQMRREAKAINFGIIYGMGYIGLSLTTGMTKQKSKKFIEKYFETYPAIYEFIRASKEKAYEDGYATTLFGRKRYLPDLYSGLPQLRASAERMAVNMPIQGTNADIIKKAMISIQQKMASVDERIRIILQVHDNLVFEIPQDNVEAIIPFLKHEMEHVYQLSVPLIVDVEIGENWGNMQSYTQKD